MTESQLLELEAICERATPGPWRTCDDIRPRLLLYTEAGGLAFLGESYCDGNGQSRRNMAFIATALTALRAENARLMAIIGKDAETIEGLRKMLSDMRHDFDLVLAAHDPDHPNHRSKGGRHHNGRCCSFGNVNPSSLREFRFLRDRIDAALQPDGGERE